MKGEVDGEDDKERGGVSWRQEEELFLESGLVGLGLA